MRWSWIPLLAGLAAVRAVRKVAKLPETGLKWPNDVVIDVPDASEVPGWGTLRKLGGVLTEIVPDPAGGRKPLGAVVGFGLNEIGRASCSERGWGWGAGGGVGR